MVITHHRDAVTEPPTTFCRLRSHATTAGVPPPLHRPPPYVVVVGRNNCRPELGCGNLDSPRPLGASYFSLIAKVTVQKPRSTSQGVLLPPTHSSMHALFLSLSLTCAGGEIHFRPGQRKRRERGSKKRNFLRFRPDAGKRARRIILYLPFAPSAAEEEGSARP